MTEVSNGAPRRRRIAVLGGGPAALAAVHELTLVEGWQERYEITVYQMGWRLGGKCAAARGAAGRIEEHGLHIYQGWYANAFWLVQQVYEKRRAMGLDGGTPFPTWESAFQRENGMILVEYLRATAGMYPWAMVFPPNDRLPGPHEESLWETLANALTVGLSAAAGALLGTVDGPGERAVLALVRLLDRAVQEGAEELPAPPWSIISILRRLGRAVGDHDALVASLLKGLTAVLRACEHAAEFVRWEGGRCALALVELMAAVTRGVLRDAWRPDARRFDFERINDRDFRAWLAENGASEAARESGIVRFIYDATFSNLATADGGGAFAAGEAVRSMILMLGYRGSMVWLPRAGIAEVVIAPAYQVLKAAGVRFAFFQRVESVRWSDGGSVEEVVVGEQARLAPGVADYDPLVEIPCDGGKVLHAWPAHPRYEQLDPEQARALQEKQIDLESPWADWAPPRRTLRRGEDFDDVILCIPVAALRDVCAELVERSPAWRGMVENLQTTATAAMQLWISPSIQELGMDVTDWGLPPGDAAPSCEVCSSPFSSWTDCSAVLPWERWPAGRRPRTLTYLCGAYDDHDAPPPYSDHGYPARELARVRTIGEQWLRDNMGFFWPRGTSLRYPRGFDLNLLVAPDPAARTAQQRFDAQHFRANVAPSERYTLCPPGARRWRMGVRGGGFDNLYLAGDWVQHAGVNAGFAEGATLAGREAGQAWLRANLPAEALAGLPPLFVPTDVERGGAA